MLRTDSGPSTASTAYLRVSSDRVDLLLGYAAQVLHAQRLLERSRYRNNRIRQRQSFLHTRFRDRRSNDAVDLAEPIRRQEVTAMQDGDVAQTSSVWERIRQCFRSFGNLATGGQEDVVTSLRLAQAHTAGQHRSDKRKQRKCQSRLARHGRSGRCKELPHPDSLSARRLPNRHGGNCLPSNVRHQP